MLLDMFKTQVLRELITIPEHYTSREKRMYCIRARNKLNKLIRDKLNSQPMPMLQTHKDLRDWLNI